MSEAQVIEIKPEKKKAKIRVEAILPIHIVEVGRLVEQSIREGGQVYPDMTEESSEVLRSHLFVYLQQPNFVGFSAKIGKKMVGVITGHIQSRPFGRPTRFGFLKDMWVDPAFKDQGVYDALWEFYTAALKAQQIFCWESCVDLKSAAEVLRSGKGQSLLHIVGGRL